MWHPKTRICFNTTEWERCGHVLIQTKAADITFFLQGSHTQLKKALFKLFKLFVCMCTPTARSWSLIEKTCFQALKETSIMRSQADTVT